jgi:ParB family chromosome partitioning protein
MPLIPLAHLVPHPDNANRMPPRLMKKLIAHIGARGEYPPLIVRPHPLHADHFQILDGHHRAEALKRLNHDSANCEIWNVDDDRAALLLLTLNRLHGEDDPRKRGDLIARLNQSHDLKSLAKLLPDQAKAIGKLMQLTLPPPPPAPPPALDRMPHAVTFFLSLSQRDRLLARLDSISANRSTALVQLLDLDS